MGDIDAMTSKICKLIDEWEFQKSELGGSYKTACELQMQLTMLKLLLGVEKFDELPAFSRYMRETTKFINNEDKMKEKKDEV